MLYLGIDQHKRQLTVNLRSEDGSVILQRQVSTQWEKVRAFFADLAEKAKPEGGFLAILEVCGMNPWLLDMLKEYGCREIVVIQPTERSKQKTDRRDAGELGHLLWVHRQQFLDGKHPLGLAARPAADAPGGRRPAVDRAPRPADEEAHGRAQRHPQDPRASTTWSRPVRPRSSRRRRSAAGWPRWNCPRWTGWR